MRVRRHDPRVHSRADWTSARRDFRRNLNRPCPCCRRRMGATGNWRAMGRLCTGACRHALPGHFRYARWYACTRCRRLAWACRRDRFRHLGGKGFPAAPLDLSRCGRRRCNHACDTARTRAAEGKSAMTNLATVFDRVPKFVLFGAAGLIQMGLIGLMVADRVSILRTWRDVTLQTRPLDPRDFLRGDYV